MGDLLVAQFNGNVARLNLGAEGSTTYQTIPGLSGLATPLDVTVGPTEPSGSPRSPATKSASSRRPTYRAGRPRHR